MKWFNYIIIFIVIGVTINLLAGNGEKAAERLVGGGAILIVYCIGWGIWFFIKKLMKK